MADRYDPKLSLRPVGERKAGDPRRAHAEQDDPLAELAKLVSGRSNAAPTRGRAAPANPTPQAPRGDTLDDLETELLNDLQASFAAVRDTLNQPAPPPPVSAQPPAPAARVEVAPPRPEAPASRVEPLPAPPPTRQVDEEPTEADLFENILPAHLAERLAPPSALVTPLPPQGPPPANDQVRAEPRRPASFANDDSARGEGTKGRAPSDGADFSFRTRASESTGSDRGTGGGSPPHVPAPRTRSRWDKQEAKPGSVSKFAPPARAAPPKPVARVDDDDEADALAELAGLPDDDEAAAFPLEGFGDLEPYEGGAEAPPYPDGDLASMMEPRRSRTPLLIASVIGLVLIGGIAVAMFRPGGTEGGAPPVIVADGEPTRITPDAVAPAAEADQSKLIYDRVNAGEAGTETTVLAASEQPIAAVPGDATADSPISRVIIPAGPGFDGEVQEGLSLDGQDSTLPADGEYELGSADPIEAIGPRRVRTVVVKPDGTIVESVASEEGQPQPVVTPPPATAAAPAAETPRPVLEPPTPAPVTDDTAAIAGTGPNGELAITPIAPDESTALAPEPAPLPTPQPEPPAAVAAVEPTAPPPAPAQSTPAGGMLVQVSSQRSEDAARATFRDLQGRYPGILGPYDVNIQRADIPDRGTFFRVRVGPFSAADAQRLCNDLKSAGGDCILAQR